MTTEKDKVTNDEEGRWIHEKKDFENCRQKGMQMTGAFNWVRRHMITVLEERQISNAKESS